MKVSPQFLPHFKRSLNKRLITRNEYLSNIISKFDNIFNDRFQFQTFMQQYQYVIAKYLLKMFVIRNDIVKSRTSDNLFV